MDAGLKRKSEDQTPEDFEQRAKKSYHVSLILCGNNIYLLILKKV